MPRSGPGNRLLLYCTIVGLAGNLPSLADEIAIYESLSDVAIGRVFLSPQQRLYLDARPIEAPRAVIERPPAEQPAEEKKNPAGYIISSTGKSSVWSRTGFVTSNDPGRIDFPGDVKIIRRDAGESSDPSHSEVRKPGADGSSDAKDDAP